VLKFSLVGLYFHHKISKQKSSFIERSARASLYFAWTQY